MVMPVLTWHAVGDGVVEPSTRHRPRVSVVIPSTRRKKIKDVLNPLLEQQYPRELLEIIVVGEAANELIDSRREIMAIQVGPIFRPGKARNLGAERATGDILIFLDDDCLPEPGFVSIDREATSHRAARELQQAAATVGLAAPADATSEARSAREPSLPRAIVVTAFARWVPKSISPYWNENR